MEDCLSLWQQYSNLYESEHDLHSRMDNLNSRNWRTWKNSALTGHWTLTFAMTKHNPLSIELIKSTVEQAIVSSLYTWPGKRHKLKHTK